MAQSTIDRILAHEPLIIAETRRAAPDFASFADDAFELMCRGVTYVDPEMIMFRMTWVHARTMAGLAVLSALRRHRVENALNLRQLIETTALFGYVGFHPAIEGAWQKKNASAGALKAGDQEYVDKARKWISTAHADISNGLRFYKNHINTYHSHGSLSASAHVFGVDRSPEADQRFFDGPNDAETRLSMLVTGQIILLALEMFWRLAQADGYRSSPTLRADMHDLALRGEKLRAVLDASY